MKTIETANLAQTLLIRNVLILKFVAFDIVECFALCSPQEKGTYEPSFKYFTYNVIQRACNVFERTWSEPAVLVNAVR